MMKHAPEPKPELHRPLEVARVATLGSHEKISADAKECQGLAARFQVPKIHAVTAALQAKSWRGGGMKISGQAFIDLDQESVVSLETFRSQTTIPVERYFLNIPAGENNDSEQDIDPIAPVIRSASACVGDTTSADLVWPPRFFSATAAR